MSEAPTGLRRVASAPGTKVLAKMSADEIMASLSDEQRPTLAALLAAEAPPAATADDDEEGELDENGKPVPKPDMADEANATASAAADAATARMTAVFASDAAKGREGQTAKLLGNPALASLSAESVIGLLADMPVAAATEDNGAAAVLAAITANNANLGGGTETEKNAGAEISNVWDRAIAANNPGAKAR